MGSTPGNSSSNSNRKRGGGDNIIYSAEKVPLSPSALETHTPVAHSSSAVGTPLASTASGSGDSSSGGGGSGVTSSGSGSGMNMSRIVISTVRKSSSPCSRSGAPSGTASRFSPSTKTSPFGRTVLRDTQRDLHSESKKESKGYLEESDDDGDY